MLTSFPYSQNEKSLHNLKPKTQSSLAKTSGLDTQHTIYVAQLRVQDQNCMCKTSIMTENIIA